MRLTCASTVSPPGRCMTRWMAGREEAVKKIAEGTPLGKVCKAENVAEVIVPLLLSAALVTGQTIIIDGGSRMH